MADFRSEIEAFAEKILSPFLNRLKLHPGRGGFGSTKEINDPVWGTITLFPLEVFLINSPIVQRLRYIKQLGVAHWVYPGAVHTRFEHSLGALHQIDNLVASINSREAGATQDVPIEPGLRSLLRLTALLHDIGHGFMSHVSEYALNKNDETIDAILAFSDAEGVEKPKLSEIAAVYLLRSPAFNRLLTEGFSRTGQPIILSKRSLAPDETAVAMADLLLGRAPVITHPMIHRLISGPFDCDKLDYLKRDARMAGVPEVVDISRLSRKIVIHKVSKDRLPENISSRIEKTQEAIDYNLLAIKSSGMKVLDELLMARLMLFSKVYKHKKVMAIEAMVRNLISELVVLKGSNVSSPLIPYLFEDDKLLEISEQVIKDIFQLEQVDPIALASARRLSYALKDRSLFVRALHFCRDRGDRVRSHEGTPQTCATRIEAIFLRWESPEAEREFIECMLGEVRGIVKLLDLSYEDPRGQIAMTHVDPSISDGEIGQAIIVGDEGDIFEYQDYQLNIKSWAEAYSVSDALGYMFCSPEYVLPVYVAVEKWLSNAGVERPSRYLQNLKISEKQLSEFKSRLDGLGYYADAQFDVCPEPDALRSVGTDNKIIALAKKFSKLELSEGVQVDAARIRSWLNQFKTNSRVSHALKMLEDFKVVDRESIRSSLRDFFNRNTIYSGGYICPLGRPKDSSSIISYYAGDIAGTELETLEAALRSDPEGKKPIVFLDDFLGSGGQVVAILRAWFEDTSTADLLDEQRDPLSRKEQEALRRREIGFYFAIGWKEGEEQLMRAFKELNLKANVTIGSYVDNEPSIDNMDSSDQAGKREFITYLESVGRALLESAKPRWSKEKYRERCLGYGNKGLLLSTTFNVPTHTVTAIWRSGSVDGKRWLPLMPRREKN